MKSIVRNKIGQRVYSFALPCTDAKATAFANEFLDGEFQILAEKDVEGSDKKVPYTEVTVMVKNSSGLKTYLSLAVQATKSEDEIYATLVGKTFNGVKADEMAIIKMRSVA